MLTLVDTTSFEIIIKKSRFICHTTSVATPKEAMDFLESIKDASASHNCYAYKINDIYKTFDDGEPGGTAGRPILSAIEGHNIDCIMVVVIRFFGGTKLGTGGLIRAYSGVTSKCLDQAKTQFIEPKSNLIFSISFESIGQAHHVLKSFDADIISEDFKDTGVAYEISFPKKHLTDLKTTLKNKTNGQVEFISN